MFDWLALLDVEASTLLPLFWLTSPPFRTATFGPLATTGFEVAYWSAVFSASFD